MVEHEGDPIAVVYRKKRLRHYRQYTVKTSSSSLGSPVSIQYLWPLLTMTTAGVWWFR